jgi:hypothetical protein
MVKPTMTDLVEGNSASYKKVEVKEPVGEVQVSVGGMIGDAKLTFDKTPLGPLDVYSQKRWGHLQKNYFFDPSIGRARCIEMSSNIALPSPGDPGYDGDLKVQKDFAPDHRSLTGPLSVYSRDHWNNLQMQDYAWSISQNCGVRPDGAKAEIIEGDPGFKEVA